ncbi:DUF1249 domain-containing protein [Aliikangiella coralliicola]|uniref:DUF1249 domain-containing protein n=1 Tax=Aliikangiella coralliicola TaxID=2592383 RepID=A0A545UC08_9GAMM|nr:DUF1249 domain-containing protein [Aliikangiella coralliicola]TQV86987.1 DUF1249 domain-containing protein [Aliikangiella coralliicola]
MNYSLAEKKPNQKAAYKPDLNELLSQCELNYWLLARLMPNLVTLNDQSEKAELLQSQWQVASSAVQLKFQITDLAKYTTTMTLTIDSPRLKITREMQLIIRLYHDVKMMEVMEGSGPGALKAVYEKINGNTKPVDEKRQINRFLGESLRACLPGND